MKHYYILSASLGLALLASCADNDMSQLTVDEPSSLSTYDYLDDYDVLKSYADFNIGVSMDASTYLDSGVEFRIAASNFNEVVPSGVFSHSSTVKASGRVDTTNVVSVIERAKAQEMKVFGYPLVNNTSLNSTYLSAKLDPNVIRPDGDDGGYALKMTNTVKSDAAADAQVAYTFARTPSVEPTITYKLKFMVRGTATGTVQCATYSNGKGSRFTPAFNVTKEWTQVEMTNSMASGITGLQSILFNVGQYLGTLYVDNIELYEIDDWGYEATDNLNTVNMDLDDAETTAASIEIQTDNGGLEDVGVSNLGEGYDPLATYVEKTDEEKATILNSEIDTYVSKVIASGDEYIDEWAVVCNPLNGTEIATSGGEALGGGEFYWADYLGRDYAVEAFKAAAQSASSSDKLYICESGMDTVAGKCDALLSLVSYIESHGCRVDGIGTTICVSTAKADRELISSMFSKLAATGKLVKITGLTVNMGDGTSVEASTEEQEMAQSDLYQYIVGQYMQQVPVAQRAGIVQSSILDTTNSPVGLWNQSYSRKHTYGGFVKGLTE